MRGDGVPAYAQLNPHLAAGRVRQRRSRSSTSQLLDRQNTGFVGRGDMLGSTATTAFVK
jgi:hypothetical protein